MKKKPKPDLMEQAGELLSRLAKGERVSHVMYPERSGAIVIASAVLAVAGEVRDLHNVVCDLRDLLRGDIADMTSPAPDDEDEEALCIWAWSFVGGHWYGACGYQAADEVDATATVDDGSLCPSCRAVIHRISEERVA